jgi:hypothetical protein
MKEKVNNLVLFDKVRLPLYAVLRAHCPSLCHDLQGTYDKLISEVPKYKMITPSILSDRLRVSTLAAHLTAC